MGRINNNKIKKLKKAANNGNSNNEENDDEKPTTTTITTTSRHDSTKNLHSRVMDSNQVQFKASNPKKQAESATFTKMKAATCPGTSHSAKVRYENIKTQFLGNMGKRLRQAQSGDSASNDELSRITKSQPAKPARLTNTMLKSLLGESLKSKKASLDLDTKDEEDANSRKKKDSLLNGVRKTSSQLAKKSKRKLKRHVWQERIGTIQSQLKKGAEKTKREKTAITGDMQPIIDSLLETGLAKSVDLDEIKKEIVNKQSNTNTKTKTKTKKPSGSTVPIQKTTQKAVENQLNVSLVFDGRAAQKQSRKQIHAEHLARQKAKNIPRETIRNKKNKEDMELFGQLTSYSEFTQNPLETLKKHYQ